MSTWDDKPNDYKHALLIIERLSTTNAELMEVLEELTGQLALLAKNPKNNPWVQQGLAALAKAKEQA